MNHKNELLRSLWVVCKLHEVYKYSHIGVTGRVGPSGMMWEHPCWASGFRAQEWGSAL